LSPRSEDTGSNGVFRLRRAERAQGEKPEPESERRSCERDHAQPDLVARSVCRRRCHARERECEYEKERAERASLARGSQALLAGKRLLALALVLLDGSAPVTLSLEQFVILWMRLLVAYSWSVTARICPPNRRYNRYSEPLGA
jgi:hypothetical protein